MTANLAHAHQINGVRSFPYGTVTVDVGQIRPPPCRSAWNNPCSGSSRHG